MMDTLIFSLKYLIDYNKPKLQAEAWSSYETLKVDQFKVKDFIAEAVKFTKPLEEEAHFVKNKKLESVKYGEALKRL